MTETFALITGASGLLGDHLNAILKQMGYSTIGLVHKKSVKTTHSIEHIDEISTITSCLDLIVNLAGAPIAGAPWTKKRKEKLRTSRVYFTEQLLDSLSHNNITCRHFISGSAIGYYGTKSNPQTEESEAGSDFSAQLCLDWENSANTPKLANTKTTLIRTGLVLSPNGGFLTPLKISSQVGLSAVFGNGIQGISWIDYRDWTAAILFIIENEITGSVNLTAPNSVSQKDFVNILSKVLKKPNVFRIPKIAFSPLGEMKTLFIEGQYVLPKKLLDQGYTFRYPTLESSLISMLRP
jgi:uncharacterized protein (TIGR01777 family)